MAKGRNRVFSPIERLNIDEIVARNSFDVKRFVLQNGLKVFLIEDHSVPLVAVNLYYLVGSRNESYGKTGLSHFLEHMMFKGTHKLGVEELSNIVTAWGGIENAATSKDLTLYWSLIPSRHLYEMLEMEADRMENAVFRDFENEKMVVMEERRLSENDPYSVIVEELDSLAVKAHPYHHPVIGWMSDIESFTPEILREHYNTYYVPNNAYLVVVGDMDISATSEKIEELFGKIQQFEHQDVITHEPEQRGERRAHLVNPGWPRVWAAAYHIPQCAHPDFPAVALASAILKDGRSSRLHTRLVESGIATYVDVIVENTIDPFLAMIFVTPSDNTDFKTIEHAIDEEIAKLASTPPKEEEFIRVLNRQVTAFVMSQDTLIQKAQIFGSFEILLGEDGYKKALRNLQAVKITDINRVVQKYFTKSNRSVVIMEPGESK